MSGTDTTLNLYQELRTRGVTSLDQVGEDLGLSPAQRAEHRAELLELGLIVPTGEQHDDRLALLNGRPPEATSDNIAVVEPEAALLRLLRQEQERLRAQLTQANRTHDVLASLADRFLHAGAATTDPEVSFRVLTDYRHIQQVLQDMSDTLQHTMASMSPGPFHRDIPERTLARDIGQLARGVRVRTVYSRRAALVPDIARYLRRKAEAGVELRQIAHVPMNMVIADEQTALLPLDPADVRAGAIQATGSGLVRGYLKWYEHVWEAATPYTGGEADGSEGPALTDQQRAVLRLLADGLKDERIARDLGVSLRTVSRIIAELLQELGAASRFEAGVRAARLGWLDD
ncbi:response regulator transcription factor [Streptomyces sp. TRM66268-LWL]|uniref:Response regulator transcription factor n=1 Tax=Streptomyces polyasparticus TaxID=2767826 RepID=A0ABR7SM07_9ACTN|nr:LuxR C-terminal-related transcriptional regulator [Streptomyces polyasparticus]MBC9716520.1 response regulator transcription factor [Streptomyces polyasparticus]